MWSCPGLRAAGFDSRLFIRLELQANKPISAAGKGIRARRRRHHRSGDDGRIVAGQVPQRRSDWLEHSGICGKRLAKSVAAWKVAGETSSPDKDLSLRVPDLAALGFVSESAHRHRVVRCDNQKWEVLAHCAHVKSKGPSDKEGDGLLAWRGVGGGERKVCGGRGARTTVRQGGRGWRDAQTRTGLKNQDEPTAALFGSRWSPWPRHQMQLWARGMDVPQKLQSGAHRSLAACFALRLTVVILSVGSQSNQIWNGEEHTVITCGPRDHGYVVWCAVYIPRLESTTCATSGHAACARPR